MNLAVLASLFAGLVIGFVVGYWWEHRKTLKCVRELGQDYLRLHALTDRTATILESIDPKLVAEAEGKLLVQEGSALLKRLHK